MKNVLICGATGFIGKNLLEHYAGKPQYNVRATHFNRPVVPGYEDVEWIKCDLRDPQQVRKALKDIDIVMQFAATTTGAKDIVSRPYIHVTDNAVMNSLLFRESFEQGVEHFIFPSCTIMYQKSDTALKEHDFNPSDDIQPFYYGAGHTKVYLENMCKFYANLGRTKYTVMRHSNVYGPHDKYDLEKSHVTGATITKVMENTSGIINVWGSGEEKRDLLYIDDLLSFIDLALERQKNNCDIYNVGLGEGIKIKDLVSEVIRCSGKDLTMEHDLTKPTLPTSLFLDCGKAKRELGWEPKHSLQEGIMKSLTWYRENLS